MDLILVGNPNVGKTTFFNRITGSNEHTGNWSGKTVDTKESSYLYNGKKYKITDLPGIYSLEKNSIEEEVSISYLSKKSNELAILLVDGTKLSRGLFLYYQLKQYKDNVMLVITMKDMLNRNGIKINIEKLEGILDTKVMLLDLKKIEDINSILEEIHEYSKSETEFIDEFKDLDYEARVINIHKKCDEIYETVVISKNRLDVNTQIIDSVLLKKSTGIPILIVFVSFIFWLSIFFSNLFQGVIYKACDNIVVMLSNLFTIMGVPNIVREVILNGGIETALFVASVMIPPMLIFFPLFSFIEEVGLIPRISFNLDGVFSKFHCNGKNSIPMILGFGCNCVGVMSTKIFENEKSRRIAILTNNFIPCNGRLPMIILLVSTFLGGSAFESTIIIILFIFCSILVALILSLILNKIYKNTDSNFIYELPSYKKPNIINLLKLSIFDKVFFVLGKSITFSFFAGVIVAILKNANVGDSNVLQIVATFLNPIGLAMGLSGIILLAFIIGISANEIVLPIVFMLYTNQGLFLNSSDVPFGVTMYENGFSAITAICMIVFSLNHFPCIASLSTIKKETNSIFFTIVCAVVPLIIGIILCICTNFILLNLQNSLFF